MVNDHDNHHNGRRSSADVKADVIILGCTLPGIVTAHKLKKRFGNSMDVVVLDLVGKVRPKRDRSKYNVTFQIGEEDTEFDACTARQLLQNIARHYLLKYARDFRIPSPDHIIAPEQVSSSLTKLFQHSNGHTVPCTTSYHDFSYLSTMERFELKQYQSLLDESMKDLFYIKRTASEVERDKLLYYDRTTMEEHICDALLLPTSREVMRLVVKLVCGVAANSVSVLFYLHQCYRTNGCKNHIDGANTRLREKLLGYFYKRMTTQLLNSLSDITFTASVRFIRNHANEKVILETMRGGTHYECNLLAMALRPDQLKGIQLDEELLSRNCHEMYRSMQPGRAKKFVINYHDSFWRKDGYSGDIFSMRGPIVWATEKPKLSPTGSQAKYSTLVGFLHNESNGEHHNSKGAVITQLVKLFGENAAFPVDYRETLVADVYVPLHGHYAEMKSFYLQRKALLEWSALDVFAEGDIAAALEAGHKAYLHLLRTLRPQAQTYDDVCATEWPTMLEDTPVWRWLAHMNYIKGLRLVMYTTAAIVAFKVIRTLMRR